MASSFINSLISVFLDLFIWSRVVVILNETVSYDSHFTISLPEDAGSRQDFILEVNVSEIVERTLFLIINWAMRFHIESLIF